LTLAGKNFSIIPSHTQPRCVPSRAWLAQRKGDIVSGSESTPIQIRIRFRARHPISTLPLHESRCGFAATCQWRSCDTIMLNGTKLGRFAWHPAQYLRLGNNAVIVRPDESPQQSRSRRKAEHFKGGWSQQRNKRMNTTVSFLPRVMDWSSRYRVVGMKKDSTSSIHYSEGTPSSWSIFADRKAECLQSATLHNVHQAARDGCPGNDPHNMGHPSASMTKVKPPSHVEGAFNRIQSMIDIMSHP
jgi:hypothetical protein